MNFYWLIKLSNQTFQPVILIYKRVILCIIIGDVHKFIGHCLRSMSIEPRAGCNAHEYEPPGDAGRCICQLHRQEGSGRTARWKMEQMAGR